MPNTTKTQEIIEEASLKIGRAIFRLLHDNRKEYPTEEARKEIKQILTQAIEQERPDEPTRWSGQDMTQKEAEIYVQGMYDLMIMVGCDSHCKHYDPLFFEGEVAHSYVLNLDDGGRHHSYLTPQWVALKALLEFAHDLKGEWDIAGWNDYFAENVRRQIREIETIHQDTTG